MPTIITSAAKEQPTAIPTTWLFEFPVDVVGGFCVIGCAVGGLHFSTTVKKTKISLKASTVEASLAFALITTF